MKYDHLNHLKLGNRKLKQLATLSEFFYEITYSFSLSTEESISPILLKDNFLSFTVTSDIFDIDIELTILELILIFRKSLN